MKLFQFAIASVVDANTGHGLTHTTGSINYPQFERNGRRIRAKSVIAVLKGIGQRVAESVATLRAGRAQKQQLHHLSRLSDHLLEDIGVTRGDIGAMQSGQIDLQQLQARRISNLAVKPLQLREEHDRNHAAGSRDAINDAVYARVKCA